MNWNRQQIFGGLVIVSAMLVAVLMSGQVQAASDRVVTITQVGCQFLESEWADYGYKPQSADDCRSINMTTGMERLSKAKPLELKPGKYIFRVSNKSVPYEVGFYLRGSGAINRLRLPRVSGGGLLTGVTKDYAIDLKEGEYIYSCPLNPTPDYSLIVKR